MPEPPRAAGRFTARTFSSGVVSGITITARTHVFAHSATPLAVVAALAGDPHHRSRLTGQMRWDMQC